MNVLAITCHPDDAEECCSGTLIKYAKRGDRVIVCHASTGSLGHVVIPPDELRVIRANEAKSAGALAGIEVICAGFDDLAIYDNNKEARDRIVDVIRYAQPDVIITHNPEDYMPDHTAVSRLVFDASFAATLPNYTDYPHKFSSPDGPPAKCVPIYYMSTYSGVGFLPDLYVDITDEIELKIQMMECHKSQLEWMRAHDHIDFAECVRIEGRFFGMQAGTQYAEGFRICHAALKNTTKNLLPQ